MTSTVTKASNLSQGLSEVVYIACMANIIALLPRKNTMRQKILDKTSLSLNLFVTENYSSRLSKEESWRSLP
jgi:hypothetical protein